MLKKDYSDASAVCRVTFSLPLEATHGGQDVRLVGDFNAWEWEAGHPLQANGDELATELELPAGRDYQFRFLIDNRVWENHWQADAYAPTPFGVYNSVVSLRETGFNGSKVQEFNGSTPVAHRLQPVGPGPNGVEQPPADDLTVIEGIGPKIAALLNEAGIRTFAELTAGGDALVDILAAAGPRYRIHNPSTWVEQARLAAAGEWQKLDKLQKRLVAGKRAKTASRK